MEKMVTRTIEKSVVTFMLVNVETAAVSNQELVLPGKMDAETAMKYAKKYFETDTIKFVSVVTIKTEETLYGMTEREFMEHAKVLPPRKVYDSEKE